MVSFSIAVKIGSKFTFFTKYIIAAFESLQVEVMLNPVEI
jgi:hypothetical protein